ncbi:hypothetical protein TRVL_06332 [Trypanosoma vivax]|nr:hypothetical protein TRVL_06332 [Trypanosoma vivax]
MSAGVAADNTPFVYTDSLPTLRVGQARYNETMYFPSSMEVQLRQRYVLKGIEKGRYHIVHLSYLGSPSIIYNLYLTHLPRAMVEQGLRQNGVRASSVPGQHQLSDVNRMYVRSHEDGLDFDFVAGEGEVDRGIAHHDDAERVPVLEVRGQRNGYPFEPEKWRSFRYNIRVDVVGQSRGLTKTIVVHIATLAVISTVAVRAIVPWLINNVDMSTRKRQ